MYKYQLGLFFIALFLFNKLSAQNTPQKQQGLLWEISGNGTSAPSYLYGTMHVSKKIAFNLSDTFFLGLKKVDKIALESDPSTWMDDFGNMDRARKSTNYRSSRNYYDNFYSDAFILNTPNKQTYQYFLATDNTQINQMLYRISGDEDFQENTYLDLFIYQAAKRSGKDVVALEDNIETLRLLNKAAEPEEEDEKKKKSYSNYGERASRETIEDAYRQGNLTLLDSLNKTALPTKKYYHYFIEERNIIMANGMDSLMQKNTTLFTGVGAAHLPGDLGMINLLKEKGYTVRPVVFTTSSKTAKMKGKIEKTFVPIKTSRQYTTDSIFQVNLPGNLYPTKIYPDYDQYLYPDVANGSFYSLARVKTYNTALGKTTEDILSSVDSLFFENIPGDIEKKSKITQDGYPGYDIVNKTRIGNYQRYRIIATPLELFVFKAGGDSKYILSPEVNKIFNSIRIEYPNHKNYTASNEMWSVNSYPKQIQTNYPRSLLASFELFQAYDPATDNWHMVEEGVLHDVFYIEEDSFELGEITRKFAEALKAEVCTYTFTTHQGKYPALVATLRTDSCTTDFLQTKVIIKGSRYYLAASTDTKNATKFFESLQLRQPTYKKPFEYLEDTSLYFSVKTILPPKPNVYEEIAAEGNNYYIRKRDKKQTFDSKNAGGFVRYRIFKLDTTMEVVSVRVKSFDKYISKKEKDFWETEDERLLEDDETLYILSKKKKKKGKRITRDIVIADSTSSRRFLIKEIYQNGLLYTIQSPIDSIDAITPFVKTFYQTFTPADTQVRPDLFTPRGLELLQDMYSEDSLTKVHIEEATSKYIRADFEATDKDSILAFINNYPFKPKELEIKVALIKELGYLKKVPLTEEILQLYKNAEGKTSIELACLQALATRKTKVDYLALKKLMATGDLPLPFYERDLNSLFYHINDSLELATDLFPDLYLYLSYPEYKTQIFELLADLIYLNKADTSMYGNQKKRLIREGINNLKRQLAGDEKKSAIYFELEYGYNFRQNQVKSTVEDYYESFLDSTALNRQIGNENSERLLTFSKLLFPLKKEPLAQKYFFSKLFEIKDGVLLYGIVNLALEAGIPVPDSLWSTFANEPKTCIPTYIKLQERNKLGVFDTACLNQEHFVKAILDLKQKEEAKKEEPDSLVFLEKHLINYDNEEGYLYFYKHKKFSNDYWTLNYAGLMPKDSTQLLPVEGVLIRNKNLIIKKDMKIDELIQDELKRIQKKKRKRIKEEKGYGTYDYNY